jgi:ketopantoate reductase
VTTPQVNTPSAPAPKRVLVVGAGAVGSLLGALLGTVGYDITLVRIFEPDSERPLVLIRPDGTRVTIPVHRFTRTADAATPDLILVAVKMPALREALAADASLAHRPDPDRRERHRCGGDRGRAEA